MTPRVNLLPPEVIQRRVERRYAYRSAVLLALLLLVLVVLALVQARGLEASRERRDVEQAELAQLERRRAELQPFGDLATRLETRNELLAAAMATEISWATVLNDLAARFPEGASLTALSATIELPPPGEPETPAQPPQPAAPATAEQPAQQEVPVEPDEPEVVAVVTFNGYTLRQFAPGVATLLTSIEDLPAFREPVLSTAASDEIGASEVTTFEGTVPLGPDAFTGRYRDEEAPAGGGERGG
jgi:Tfp pilus assembly protein PilN